MSLLNKLANLPTPPKPQLPQLTQASDIFSAQPIKKIAAKSLASLPVITRVLPKPPHFLQKVVVEKALNTALAEQIEMGDFEFLEGHCLHLEVQDLNLDFYLSYENDQLILATPDSKADVHFRGNSSELILLASRSEDPDTFFFQRRLVIEGDTELGLYIKNIIDSVDFDSWPSWLNKLMNTMAELIELENQNTQGASGQHLVNA